MDQVDAFEHWWKADATPEQRQRLRLVAQADEPVPADLVTAMARGGVLIAGAHFPSTSPGPTFHLPREVRLAIERGYTEDGTGTTS